MPATIPIRACLISLCVGIISWVYMLTFPLIGRLCLLFLGDEGAFIGSFVLFGALVLFAVTALLTLCVGIVFLAYYGFCYPASGPKRPVVVRCGLYLLVPSTFCVCMPWFLMIYPLA